MAGNLEDKIMVLVEREERASGADVALAVVNDEGEQLLGYRETEPFAAYSLGKLVVAAAYQEANVSDHQHLELEERFLRNRGLGALATGKYFKGEGTGILQFFPKGYKLSAHQALRLMLTESDTVASRLLVDRMGGPWDTNRLAYRRVPGLYEAGLEVLDDEHFRFGEINAQDAVKLLSTVIKDSWARQCLERSHASYGLRRHLPDSKSDYPNPRLLLAARLLHGMAPDGLYHTLLQSSRYGQGFPSKEGAGDGHAHDVARIKRLTVAVLTRGYDPERPTDYNHPARALQSLIGVTVEQSQWPQNQPR